MNEGCSNDNDIIILLFENNQSMSELITFYCNKIIILFMLVKKYCGPLFTKFDYERLWLKA